MVISVVRLSMLSFLYSVSSSPLHLPRLDGNTISGVAKTAFLDNQPQKLSQLARPTLVPLSQVLKDMREDADNVTPIIAVSISVDSVVQLSSVVTPTSVSAITRHSGPGPVVLSTTLTSQRISPTLQNIALISSSSISASSNINIPTSGGNHADESHTPAPVHKLAIIGLCFFSFFIIMGILFGLARFSACKAHLLSRIRRKKTQPSENRTWQEKKPILQPWIQFPKQISRVHFNFPDPKKTPSPSSKPTRARKVMDITTDFPRSRFSDSSSDYAHCSIKSGTSFASDLSLTPHEVNVVAENTRSSRVPVPLLTPEEFFRLSSTEEPLQPSEFLPRCQSHLRTNSAPTFSNTGNTFDPGHNKRSQSVYIKEN